MLEVRTLRSIADIDARTWNALLVGAVEDHAYLLAVELARLPSFTHHYFLIAMAGDVVAVAPAFTAPFPLDTMMDGAGASVIRRLRSLAPAVLAPRLACLGSPCTETAGIGIATGLDDGLRGLIADRLVGALTGVAADQHCALLGTKDLPADEAAGLREGLGRHGFAPTDGQPIAWLPIDFDDIDSYLARLSRATRRGLRRKLRQSEIRIERRESIAGLEAEIHALYRQTLARARHRFEELTPAFFSAVDTGLGARAFHTLYWLGDRLLAANLLIRDSAVLLDKYWCMADEGRDHDLYYLSWIENVRYCLEHGLRRYQAGQANVVLKRSLGCRFDATTTYVRHRNPLLNGALRRALPLFGASPTAAEAA